jgi:hypothetical protein
MNCAFYLLICPTKGITPTRNNIREVNHAQSSATNARRLAITPSTETKSIELQYLQTSKPPLLAHKRKPQKQEKNGARHQLYTTTASA